MTKQANDQLGHYNLKLRDYKIGECCEIKASTGTQIKNDT